MASTYLTRTFGTGSRRTFTKSLWIKRSKLGISQDLFGHNKSPNYNIEVQLVNNGTLTFYNYNNSATTVQLTTNRLFRDTSAWYHIVIAVDTTQATEADRLKIYVNGVQETSFSTANYPSLNEDLEINNGETGSIGAWVTGSDTFDGLMSYVAFIDGTQELPTVFGETDSTTGEWKIKTTITPSSGWGTNGYLILKDGNSVTDQSGNSNNWTVAGGTLTKTEDCPSNVFATINPLDNLYIGGTLSNGNNKIVTGVAQEANYITSTLGASSGKYYCEIKNLTPSGRGHAIGISGKQCDASNDTLGGDIDGFGYRENGSYKNNGSTTAYGDSYTENDIIGIALDLDNNKLYFSKNGTWQNSGDPTSGATGTGAISIGTPSTGFYFIALGDESGNTNTFETNFGNGYFGTTAVSSAGTNASGIGIFEYDVPSGFTALSTKGLNE